MPARPKRPNTDHGNIQFPTSVLYDRPSAPKKPRFDVRNPSALALDSTDANDVAPEDEAILNADEIGKQGQQAKRNAVHVDGYDSDSSNEGFGARAEAKAKEQKQQSKQKSKDEEQADMFADLDEDLGRTGGEGADGDEDEELGRERKQNNKKNVRFLEAEEIEGQVGSSKSGGHVSANFSLNGKGASSRRDESSSDESDANDSDRASIGSVDAELGAGSKKSHAPRLDAFNMKSEQEEGRFDDQGNYVRKAADPDAVHDTWLEGLSKKDMKKAREAADKREDEQRHKRLEDDALLTSDVLGSLITHLERGETALEALARLNRSKPSNSTKQKSKSKWHANRNKRSAKTAESGAADGVNDTTMTTDEDPAPTQSPEETRRLAAIEAISTAADSLLTRGQAEIYDMEREMLTRLYKRETGDDWLDESRSAARGSASPLPVRSNGSASDQQMYEYRWSDTRDGGEVHGPYGGKMMREWNAAGYFGEGVEFRLAGPTPGAWTRTGDFT